EQSLSDEDLPEKIYSNPLFVEEIIPMKIDTHPFNAESDLIESMLNHDSSIIISSKIDSLFDEFMTRCRLALRMMTMTLKGIFLALKNFFSNNSHSLPKNESFHFDIPSSSRPPAKPLNDDEIKPNSGTLTVKVVGDIFEHYVPMPRLFPTQPTLASNQEKSPHLLSHRSLKAFSAFFYKSDDDLWREHSYLGCSIYPFLPSLTSSSMGGLGQAK
nr:hypothetical protein [Tanacetum cinerariifolium]